MSDTQKTFVVLSNAAELATTIAQGVVGDDLAETFNGAPFTADVIRDLAVVKINNNLFPIIGGH